jgi:hypothetical protein
MLPDLPFVSETDPVETATLGVTPHVITTQEPTAIATGSTPLFETEVTSEPTVTTAVTDTPVPTLAPTPTPRPPDLSLAASDVYLYPVPSIFAGDKVTFQIFPHVPDNVAPDEVTVQVLIDGATIVDGALGGRSHLSGEVVGLFEWAWNTTGLLGTHELQVLLDPEDSIRVGDEDPENNQVVLTVSVHDRDGLPPNETNAIWKRAESACCNVHVVSGTAADRDLPELLAAIDSAMQQAISKLNEQPRRKFDVYLIDRVIGQGGYAGSALVVSYLDRDYASNDLHQVLVHEAVHLLDRQFAPQRISFLAEGLAVWASDGHYKQEDLNLAAAALLELEHFVPVERLINQFYPVQHEIGYIEAGGLVTYMVETYGWPRFRNFYSEVTQDDEGTLADTFDAKLRSHFNTSLDELESSWQAYLRALPQNREVVADVQTTIRYYETMRRYQMLYDPTAHFLIAWLPSPNGVQETGNPADLTRHPKTALNVTLEIMLQAAGDVLHDGDHDRANVILNSIARVLDREGHFIDPLAISYWNIVQTATSMGYEVHQVTLTGNEAAVIVAQSDTTTLTRIDMILQGQEWMLSD